MTTKKSQPSEKDILTRIDQSEKETIDMVKKYAKSLRDQAKKDKMEFKKGDLSTENMAKLFGEITEYKNPNETLTVVNSYNSDLSFIYRLRILGETSIWISNFNTKILRQISFEDNNIKTLHEISADIFDMSNSSNNDIFLSMRDTCEVKMLMKSGKIKSVFSVSTGLLPRAIHVTKDNRILLGVTDRGHMYKTGDDSFRKIMVYGMDGKQKQSFGDEILTFPYRITTNTNRDIVVIDVIADDSGRIINLGQDGNLKWIYQGHPSMNSQRPFDPRDIVTTPKGLVIVADCISHGIHVLSEEGTLITCKNMKEQGVVFPYSLDIDNKGLIWVGCDTFKGKADAKIHNIEIS
ncbi:uncharacterized protein LOC127731959 [Mytilus californianus]|uniref:uncharacterized protein LOC127731959 n=1 Tax=Mytilus californianus TaxID=6549 RepID=UPI002247292B|nr:uncharacterized protein LOC127731959 [Mytilus californianus]